MVVFHATARAKWPISNRDGTSLAGFPHCTDHWLDRIGVTLKAGGILWPIKLCLNSLVNLTVKVAVFPLSSMEYRCQTSICLKIAGIKGCDRPVDAGPKTQLKLLRSNRAFRSKLPFHQKPCDQLKIGAVFFLRTRGLVFGLLANVGSCRFYGLAWDPGIPVGALSV